VPALDEEETGNAGSGVWKVWLSWALVAPAVLWAVVRTLGLESGFPMVQLIAFTPYVLLLALLVCLAVVLMRQWLPFLAGLLAVVALGIAVVPRELGGPDETSGGQTVRLLASNLARGKADLGQLMEIAEARDVDILSIQELTPESLAGLEELGIASTYRYRVTNSAAEARGGAIFSRFPLVTRDRPDTDFAQPIAEVRITGAIPVELMSVHPMAPAGPKSTRQWEGDFEELPVAGDFDLPTILSGDFNATLDHENLRELIDTGYRDAGDAMGRGLVTTWPSELKWPLPVTLDHTLVEEPIGIIGYDVEKISDSDHRAVYTELVVPKR